MAESKFLPFQDQNGDMLPDVCPETEPAQDICLKCSPNPLATVPSWRKRSQKTPFLNEKLCKYQVTYRTQEKVLGGAIDSHWEKYALPWEDTAGKERQGAIKRILIATGKDYSQETIDQVKVDLEYTEYWLSPRTGSYVRLLYSVDFDIIDDLPEAVEEEEEADEPGDKTVTYDAHDMLVKSIRVRKGLSLYNRYYKVFTAMENANLVFSDTGKIFDLTDYGDSGLWGSNSLLAGILGELDAWLNVKGFNIPNTGQITFFKDKVSKIEFTFDPKYKLKKMKVWTDDCGEVPKYYSKAHLADLNARRSWRDKTAVAYFAQLDELESEMSARVEQPWLEVLKTYTYPVIHSTLHAGHQDVDEKRDIPGCIAEVLENEAKQLGQDILDDVFSIGDAIAYAFHKNLCRHNPDEVHKDNLDIGMPFGIAPEETSGPNIFAAATMQAYKEIDPRDQVFAHFCLRLLSFSGAGEGCPPMGAGSGSPVQMIDNLWAFGFDRIKVCGLLDLLMQVMDCLLGGLTLDEALRKMLLSALKAMAWDDFGEIFVGLPPDEQEKLDELVHKNLANPPGNQAVPGLSRVQSEPYSSNESGVFNDNPEAFFGKFTISKPWEDEEIVAKQKSTMRENNGNMVPTKAPGFNDDPTVVRRTLRQKLAFADTEAANNDLDPNLIMDAYIMALLEYYQDDFLSLLDKLNSLPGAQIIGVLISTIECPRPPLFNPGVMDFVKSIGLPFCRGKQEIVLPRWENPFGYIPKLKDILAAIFEMLKRLVIQLVIKIIVRVLVKICELIGDAICKALELTGDIVGSLPAVIGGRQKFSDVIRDSICGPDADNSMVDNTVTQLMADLGPGGAALANPARALTFAEDLSAISTQNELVNAILGAPSQEWMDLAQQVVENEYPDYEDALPNGEAIAAFFKNVGFLMPAQFRKELKDSIRLGPPLQDLPANPTLCATPEKIEEFKNMRCQMLAGRASQEQCEVMFDKWRGTMLDDLGEMADIVNKGIGPYIADQMPPLFSDPGCENGLLPLESEIQATTATSVLKKDMDKLKVEFSSDMLENGPGKTKWGFINMVMSDTMAQPFTTHQRKVFSSKENVDFYVNVPFTTAIAGVNIPALGSKFASLADQEGAYPEYVAEYLMYQFQNAGGTAAAPETATILDLRDSMTFSSTNLYQQEKVYRRSFDRMNIDLGSVDMTLVPDPGYNVDVIPDMENEQMVFSKAPRKEHDAADIVLSFRDNAKGMRLGPNGGQSVWAYGFDLRCYFSDLVKIGSDSDPTAGSMVNHKSDNIRMYINEMINLDAEVSDDKQKLLAEDPEVDAKKRQAEGKNNGELKYRKYEFMSIDDGLDSIFRPDTDKNELGLVDFPHLAESFERYVPNPPQVLALYDLFNGEIDRTTIKEAYDSFMSAQFRKVAAEVGANEQAWLYGAEYDDLGFADFDYVVPKSATSLFQGASSGDLISKAEVKHYDSDGKYTGTNRPVTEDDAILGESRAQNIDGESARVIYLDPGKYGGTYMNPPLYVRPLTGSGWSGVVDLLFPEMAPCKPAFTDLVDFGEIQDKIDQMYPTIPEDSRLKSDPDCVVEVPYNRILERASRAGLMGVIMSAIKMFVSVHFLKSLATFTKFAPKFPNNYSNVYAAYIIARMEESFKDAGANFLSPFKDTEFWFAFLEQSVQLYAYRTGPNGDIPVEDVPVAVDEALARLDDLQEDYDYPFYEDLMLSRGREISAAISRGRGVSSIFNTLEHYREDKNLEAIFETADDAKIILQQLVLEQLQETGEKFIKNLKPLGMKPTAVDLDYYYMSEFCDGSTLALDGEIIEKPAGLPTPEDPDPAEQGYDWPGPFYSHGNEFTTVDNNTYVGYYHGHIDTTSGSIVYMSGDVMATTGSVEDLDKNLLLRPFAYKTIMGITGSDGFQGIGDVPEYGRGGTGTEDKPFIIEKYIAINGGRKKPSEAVDTIRSLGHGIVSDYYPGTMRLVYPPPTATDSTSTAATGAEVAMSTATVNPTTGKPKDRSQSPIGVDGEFGVRYGLSFKMRVGDGPAKEITSVEIDALDIPVTAFTGIESDGKLLLCLLNKLKEDQKYRLVTQYIFSLKKVLGITAIYNDMGFLPSIGEYTVARGDLHKSDIGVATWPSAPHVGPKPGMYVNVVPMDVSDGDGGTIQVVDYVETFAGARGWVATEDRGAKSIFVLDYDEWDQHVLRRSVRLMKKMFHVYYHARKFDPGAGDANGAQQWLEQLRERFKLSPGARFLPWWKKNRLRSNPFNAEGELCDKKD